MTEFLSPTYDDIASGKAVYIEGKFYHRTHIITYAQQGVCTIKSYASEESALEAFNLELAKDREAWAKCSGGFSESTEHTSTTTTVRFRSKLKTGKPGNLKGLRMLVEVKN